MTLLRLWTLMLCLALLEGCAGEPTQPDPQPATATRPEVTTDPTPRPRGTLPLSNDQRRAFLRTYAPIILKAADEAAPKHVGQDWLTNFFFDGDRDLSNNKAHWSRELRDWIAGATGQASWQLRPTLYTALIEFQAGETKSLVLLYHLYHAKQRGSIHDWERVELRLDNVVGGPGEGERVAYAALTEHSIHRRIAPPKPGQRLVVWQAPWSKLRSGSAAQDLRKAELRGLAGAASDLRASEPSGTKLARIELAGLGSVPFHYAFAPGSVSFLGRSPQVLTQSSAAGLAAASASAPSWDQVRVLGYELQDLADVLPTHLDAQSWSSPTSIELQSPVRDAEGQVTIPPGLTKFYVRARDSQDPDEKRKGYPWKHWFWGTYDLDGKGWTRAWIESLPGHLRQHDYFAHEGRAGRLGAWLRGGSGWWRPEQGGFDGRWSALFED